MVAHTQLKRWIAESKAWRALVILDCCHAGTTTKGFPSASRPAGDYEIQARFLDVGFVPAAKHLATSELKDAAIPAGKEVVWLGGCKTEECGWSIWWKNSAGEITDAYGLFTRSLLTSLAANPRAKISEFHPQVVKAVVAESGKPKYVQQHPPGISTPQFEGNLDAPLIRGIRPVVRVDITPPPPPPPPPPVASSRRDFPIEIALNQASYRKDDKLTVTVKPERDCYLRLYLINAAAELQQIFPNEFQPDNFLRRGDAVQVPAASGGKFEFLMEGPFGVETIVVVGSTEQFTDLQKPRYQNGFFDLGAETPRGALGRGIRVEGTAPTPVAPPNRPQISINKVQYSVADR